MQRSLPPTMMPSLSQTASHSSMLWVVKMTLRDADNEEITFHMDLKAETNERCYTREGTRASEHTCRLPPSFRGQKRLTHEYAAQMNPSNGKCTRFVCAISSH